VASPRHALSSAPLSLRDEAVRKALHVSAAAFPVAYALGASRGAIESALAVTSASALLVEGLRRSDARFRNAFNHTFRRLLRSHEQKGISGATWLALSCLVAVAVLSRNAAIAALWCATVGDPAATIAGKWLDGNGDGNPERSGKTMAGSIGCAVASYGGAWLLAGYAPLIAAAVAAAATIAEALPVRIDDNVRIVAAAGAIAQLLA